ncbi:MAG: TonB-dependent receptor [Cytophagales bacterium]|nr:TonB-dependent receptor [Bernardetiaceae bacterium]MDW8204574.1 TonB-dependent receptor [Cytophagales bacterium]
MRKLFTLFLFAGAFLVSHAIVAQRGTVQGKVNDETGEPTPGVNVVVVGSSIGTAVKADGTYSLSVPAGTLQLQFSGVGYKTVVQSVSVKDGETLTLDVTINTGTSVLNDVVISATRQPVRKIEATTAVSVLNADELLRQVAPTIGDALRFTPGVFVASQRGRVRANIIMRGFPENLGTEDKYTTMLIDGLPAYAGSGNPYDVYFQQDLNVERIEVVRGAAATLFGRSAAAGVYNIVSKVGGEKTHGIIEQILSPSPSAKGGMMTQTGVNVNGAIAQKLRYNVGGFYLNDPGFRTQAGPDKGYQFRANFDYLLGRGSIRLYGTLRSIDLFNNVAVPVRVSDLKIDSRFTNRFTDWSDIWNSVNFTRPTGITAPTVPLFQGSTETISGNPNNIEQVNVGEANRRGNFGDVHSIGLRFNYDFGKGFSIQNNLRYQRAELGTKFITATAYTVPANNPSQLFANVFNSTGKRVMFDIIDELILKKEATIGSSKHVFTAGGYLGYYEQRALASGVFLASDLSDGTVRLRTAFPGAIPGILTTNLLRGSDTFAEVTNTSAFVGDEAAFAADKLKLNFGFRFDNSNIKILHFLPKSANGQITGPLFVSNFTDRREVSIGAFSATLGINYLITPNTAVYGNFVRAFRAPDEQIFVNMLRGVPGQQPPPEQLGPGLVNYRPIDTNNRPFLTQIDRPETVYNAEIGFRTSALNDDLSIDLAGYYTQINDRIISGFRDVAPGFPPQSTSISEGSVAIRGFEGSLTYTPSWAKGLLMRTSLTLQSSEFLSIPNGLRLTSVFTLPEAELKGKKIKNVPGTIWNFNVQYDRKFSKSFAAGLGIDGNYMANRYGDELNRFKLADVMLLNGNVFAKASLKNGNDIRVSVRISNLTDTQEILWLLDITNPIVATSAPTNASVIPGIPFLPRRTFFTVAYSF